MEHNLTFGGHTPATQERLGELILYVAAKTKNIDDFGAIKINKTIVFADLMAFKSLGYGITGAQHHRIGMGPVPKHILVVERNLKEGEALRIDVTEKGHKRVALRDANVDLFSDEELAIVDSQIARLKDMTSNAVSNHSHDIRWEALRDKDLMPYEFAFLDDSVTSKDKTDAKYYAEEFGW